MTLFELFALLRKRLRLVILLPLFAAVVVGVGSLFLPNEYTASTTMYVLSKNGDEGTTTEVTQSDLNMGQMLTTDVATILNSSRVRSDVIQELGLTEFPYKLTVTNSTGTRVITLTVTGNDPEQTAAVANALVADTSEVASEIMQIQAVNVIDEASVPEGPSGPRRSLYVAVGLMAGLFAAICLVVIEDMLDTRVRSGSDVEEIVGVPVIGHFPQVEGN